MTLMTPQWREGVPDIPEPPALPPYPLKVNTVTGTAGGTGSAASPLNTLDAARIMCAGLPNWIIEVYAPESTPLRQEVTYESTEALLIRGEAGQKWFIYGSDVLTNVWDGAGPVYSKTLNYTVLTQVVVQSLTEVIGDRTFQRKMLQNTATPTAPGAGEFGYAGGILYVRLWDSSNPELQTFEVARRNTCVSTIGYGRLTIEDGWARHALVNGWHNGRAGQPLGTGNLHVTNSKAEYCVNGGVGAAGQNEETINTNVECFRVGNDGFNLHVITGAGYMENRGCKGGYSGDKEGQSAQGASNHEHSTLVLKGGEYNWSVSGGMVVIETARCDLIGNSEWGPIIMSANMRLGNTPGPVSTQAACAWLDTSKGTVTGPVLVTGNGGVGVRRAPGATLTGYSNITSTGNALPDIV